MKVVPWLVLLSFSLISCSGSKSAQQVSEDSPQIELSADEEVIEPTEELSSITDETQDVTDVTSGLEPMVKNSNLEKTSVSSALSGELSRYEVQANETLMMIAFKIYGDYGRWKEIANQNQDVLKGSILIRTGMKLRYYAPAEEFNWNPQGNPYLLKTGDTLGGISKEVYSTVRKWKLIWENNRPLIKDPNKIYAGFTIYYLEDGREVASEI
jgi:nucleoid-associated protein YgaU